VASESSAFKSNQLEKEKVGRSLRKRSPPRRNAFGVWPGYLEMPALFLGWRLALMSTSMLNPSPSFSTENLYISTFA